MGKGWVGFLIVCGLGGCSDDEPTWVPPLEDAGTSTTSRLPLEAGARSAVYSVDTSGSSGAPSADTPGSSFTTAPADASEEEQSTGSQSTFGRSVGGDAALPDDASSAHSVPDEATTPDAQVATSRSLDAGAALSQSLDAAGSSASPGSSTSDSTVFETTASTTTVLDASELDSSTSVVDGSATNGESTVDSSNAVSDAGASDSLDTLDASLDGGTNKPIEARAGFIDVEPVNYTLQGTSLQTSSARLFYAFTPADELAQEAPVFVFFNGGPGSATSSGLLTYGTGPFSLPSDLNGPDVSPNAWSWTQMGNLLYFDTRQAGFSYSTLPDPSDDNMRASEWNERNFNLNVDAADSIRLLLRVLSAEPALKDNPIILVGESYGGTRATMMLRFLLNPSVLRQPSVFQDEALADEITAFFEANRGQETDTAEAQAKRQLPAQVLIQPFFAGNQFPDQDDIRCLPDSVAQQVASEVGTNCEDIELYRDAYKIDEAPTWSTTLDELAQQALMHPTKLPTLLGVELSSIAGLAAFERGGAYRDSQSGSHAAPQPEFLTALGQLEAWDAYHLTLTPRAPWADNVYYDVVPCAYFSWVVQQVDTLITNAKWDNVVLTKVLPTTLYDCSQLYTTPFVDSVGFAPEGLALGDSGQMIFQFNDQAPEGRSQTAVQIRGYDSGHMVTVTHAEPLFKDVRTFLTERGVL